jgi:predicted RNase H-like HicB family nuclease
MRYTVVIEPAGDNFSAYVPDLPGCVATGSTEEETAGMIAEAIGFHIAGMREEGLPVPPPRARAFAVEAAS